MAALRRYMYVPQLNTLRRLKQTSGGRGNYGSLEEVLICTTVEYSEKAETRHLEGEETMAALRRYMYVPQLNTLRRLKQTSRGRGIYGSLEEVHVCTTVEYTEKAEADI